MAATRPPFARSSIQVGKVPRVHGSGLFMRGETHVLTIATLGTPGDAQRLDTLQPEEEKRYIHHYNFPPFSTGEAYPLRGPKRREIGHGALAERALVPVIPEDFPYTLRLVSEVVSSNGSTSMASVCGSTLALMDAGVPITAPVAGIAMGLIQDMETGDYKVFSDIQGMEDALGDMDFKVAGTAHGITALQMDLKIKGLDFKILREALDQARTGRLFILGKMMEALPESRAYLSPFAPRILTINIDPEKIGKLIGPGGKTIRGLQEKLRRQDRRGRRRHGLYFRRRRGRRAGVGRSLTHDGRRGSRQDLHRHRGARRAVWRLRQHPARRGRHGAHQPTGRLSCGQGGGHCQARRRVDRHGHRRGPGGKVRLSRQAVLEGWSVEDARSHDRRFERRCRRSGGDRGNGASRP